MQRRTLLSGAMLGATLPGRAAWAARPPAPATSSILVGATPGGAADIIGRLFAQQLERERQAPFVVENRAGAVGTLGVVAAIKARPDGHTIALGSTGPIAISPALMKSPPYDPVRELAHAALLATTPNVLLVPANGPLRSLQDLRAAGAGGQLNFASGGNGT
ncbi:MAG TPA: tripartite tricarboxylate transporter substrate-binding protein, partial [Pseudorhodoferax sp.]|nr:tripartite tricarboxylate transporter substrate-binding protein [Pseudorhodoferax sp.]